jgi:hypothetical protein
MANMAAPYVHPRLIPAKQGKKAAQAKAAKTAIVGSPWQADLGVEVRAN